MLTKRAQILFVENDWKKVSLWAKKKKTSVSALAREALMSMFEQEATQERSRRAIEETLKIRPKAVKGKIDYKEMINYGRKY